MEKKNQNNAAAAQNETANKTARKSPTRIERSSKNSFHITKTAVGRAFRMIESTHMGKLNVPYQNALDEAYGKLQIQHNQKEADRLLLQISIIGTKAAAFLDYIPSKDQFKTLQGNVLIMSDDFVKVLADMLIDTDFVTKGVTPAENTAENTAEGDDDFNEPEFTEPEVSDNEPELPLDEAPEDVTPAGDDDFEL